MFLLGFNRDLFFKLQGPDLQSQCPAANSTKNTVSYPESGHKGEKRQKVAQFTAALCSL